MKIEISGEKFINIICERMKEIGKGDRLYDSNILQAIKELTVYELREIISFGDVHTWHNERIKRLEGTISAPD